MAPNFCKCHQFRRSGAHEAAAEWHRRGDAHSSTSFLLPPPAPTTRVVYFCPPDCDKQNMHTEVDLQGKSPLYSDQQIIKNPDLLQGRSPARTFTSVSPDSERRYSNTENLSQLHEITHRVVSYSLSNQNPLFAVPNFKEVFNVAACLSCKSVSSLVTLLPASPGPPRGPGPRVQHSFNLAAKCQAPSNHKQDT